MEIGHLKTKKQIIVGFAAETNNLIKNAKLKLKKKKLDMIVANLIGKNKYGFGKETNRITLIFSNNKTKIIKQKKKEDIAHIILDNILSIHNTKKI